MSEDAYSEPDRRKNRRIRDEGEDANAGVPAWARKQFPWAKPTPHLREQEAQIYAILAPLGHRCRRPPKR